ncbi:hypothetical protein [Streptomyces paludis]|uniref:hypothetical protein n=1 Tax=Streptomyces paludis TaxID=2282738 RepID=UPI0013B45DBF|nr:hypothetical protein [Streptomyces paludis]
MDFTVKPSTTIRLPDGTELAWEGFGTGPLVYDGDFAGHSERLLGLSPSEVAEQTSRRLLPYRAGGEGDAPALILHSATRATKGFDGDVSDLAAGRTPYDCATYLEARAVFLARPGDLTVGRTAPWKESVRVFGIDSVDLGDLEHYYLYQALLEAAVRHPEGTGSGATGTTPKATTPAPLTRIIDWVRARPHAIVRTYALDREMQIFLLWLLRRTGRESLRIDANNHVVSLDWNRKRHIHPFVEDAESLSATGMPPDELLAAEQRLGEGYRRVGMAIPVLPGYTMARPDAPAERFVEEAVRAAALLRRRYGLTHAFLKPSQSGSGARIVGPIGLQDLALLREAAADAHQYGDDYLLEAAVDYVTVPGALTPCPVAPSGHIRNGEIAPGLTLQILDRYSWEGNAYIDRPEWERCGLAVGLYDDMRRAMHDIHAAFRSEASAADGSHGGLVTGGVDFAVGRLGGVFGDRVLTGAIDFNFSSHGAELLRAFHERITADRPPAEHYTATRVYRPTATATLTDTRTAVLTALPSTARAEVVACVPNRWGMVAATGTHMNHAMERTQELIDTLTTAALAQNPKA